MNHDQDIDYSEFSNAGLHQLAIDVPPEIPHKCFACAPTNPIGLHLRFFAFPKQNIPPSTSPTVYSKYQIGANYCGFPRISHGGILTTLLDELMAHASYYTYGKYGITKDIRVEFRKPVLVETPIYIRAWVEKEPIIQPQTPDQTPDKTKSTKNRKITVKGEIYTNYAGFQAPNPKIHVRGEGTMILLNDERYLLNYKSE
ncbi:MAG: PaaI family thioesterase [Promethearchaeota archaeon]